MGNLGIIFNFFRSKSKEIGKIEKLKLNVPDTILYLAEI